MEANFENYLSEILLYGCNLTKWNLLLYQKMNSFKGAVQEFAFLLRTYTFQNKSSWMKTIKKRFLL